MKHLGIILVRSGSKRFPNKNISSFNNTSLINNTINKLQKAGIDGIVISTDYPDILEQWQLGKGLFLNSSILLCTERPLELVQDDSKIEDVILDIIQRANPIDNYTEDYIIILAQVTSPNWSPHRLTYAIHKLISGKYNSVISVSPDYKPNGAFYIIRKSTFLKYKKLYVPNMFLTKMPWEESTDIDFEYQLYIAESLSKGNYD